MKSNLTIEDRIHIIEVGIPSLVKRIEKLESQSTQTAKSRQVKTQVIPLLWYEIIPKNLGDFTNNSTGRYWTKEDATNSLNKYYTNKSEFKIVKVKAV